MLLIISSPMGASPCTQGVLETNQKKFRFELKQTGLFRCFNLYRNNQNKQNCFVTNKTTLNFRKISKYALFQTVWVGLPFVSVQSKHRNSLFWYRSETTKINCFETNRKKQKKPEKPKFSFKNSKICSLSKCFGWSSVCFDSIETLKLSVSVQKRNNQNKRFVSDNADCRHQFRFQFRLFQIEPSPKISSLQIFEVCQSANCKYLQICND